MGACFNNMELDSSHTKEQVKTKFDDRVEQDGYDYGHSYSGSFSEFRGLVFHNRLFDTYDEAVAYVEERGEKWGPAVCVQYKHVEPSKMLLKHDKARMELQKKIWNAEALLGAAQRKARINNRSSKPAYVTKAEEKLQKVRDAVQPKIDERTEKIAAIQKALGAKSKDIRWFLGGWCSS